MISAFRFYEMYIAMSLHFKENSNYDFIKYNGETSAKEQTFLARKDRYFFEKFARKVSNENEAIPFLASNFVNGVKYVRNLDDKHYREFLAYADAIEYRFERDLERYSKEDPIQLCYTGSTEPYIYLILLNECSRGAMFKLYDEKYGSDDILWSDLRDNKLKKLTPFIQIYYHLTPDLKRSLREKVENQNV